MSCLRKQHNGRDWASNHRPSDLKSNAFTATPLPSLLLCVGLDTIILAVAVIVNEKIFRKNMKISRGISFSEDVKNICRVSVVFSNIVFRTKLKAV